MTTRYKGGHGIGINIHDYQPNLEMATYALKTGGQPKHLYRQCVDL